MIAEQLESVLAAIRAAAEAAGRDPEEVRLVAVSKGHPASAIREAYAAGQRDFGENYAQELVAKARELEDLRELRWHFIGHLQRNKAKDVVRAARVVAIDRAELAVELDRRASEPLDVLVEVNVAREPQKAGCDPDAVPALLDALRGCTRLRPIGLMCIPPADDDPEASRPHFARLRAIAEGARAAGHASVRELSMGMSDDFPVAIAEGATIVRVGTAIFGARPTRGG